MGRGRLPRGCATTSRASSRTARPRSSGRSRGSSTPRATCAAGSSRSPPTAVAPARRDVEAQVDRLVVPGFATRSGAARLPDVERYLHAAARRLERLPDNPARDLDRMRGVERPRGALPPRVDEWPAGRPLPAGLREVPWMLEELRVSHFAQGLGTRGQVSAKRIRRAIEEAATAPR